MNSNRKSEAVSTSKPEKIANAIAGAIVGGLIAGPVGAVAGATIGALVEKGPRGRKRRRQAGPGERRN